MQEGICHTLILSYAFFWSKSCSQRNKNKLINIITKSIASSLHSVSKMVFKRVPSNIYQRLFTFLTKFLDRYQKFQTERLTSIQRI